MKTQIIILAAGNSTRMKSETPKVLMEVGGQTMIERVVATARGSVPETAPLVVVNERNREAMYAVLGDSAQLVIQKEQKGTAHAVQSAQKALSPEVVRIVVLYGDHPFIHSATIQRLIEAQKAHPPLALVVFSTDADNSLHDMLKDFGRIIRDDTGRIIGIREVKDATLEELAMTEKNPGYYCFDSMWLWKNIEQLENLNAQKEYYLTDLIARAAQQGYEIKTIEPHEVIECVGINNPEQLQWAQAFLQG